MSRFSQHHGSARRYRGALVIASTLVEAMACGAPAVARQTAHDREVLGEAGPYISSEGGKIVTALQTVLGDAALQDRLSANAKARQRSLSTWKLVRERYEDILEAVSQPLHANSPVPA
jgi:glycosyltransferase involved in cell wall biosynthesis